MASEKESIKKMLQFKNAVYASDFSCTLLAISPCWKDGYLVEIDADIHAFMFCDMKSKETIASALEMYGIYMFAKETWGDATAAYANLILDETALM